MRLLALALVVSLASLYPRAARAQEGEEPIPETEPVPTAEPEATPPPLPEPEPTPAPTPEVIATPPEVILPQPEATAVPVATPGMQIAGTTVTDAIGTEALHRLTVETPIQLTVTGPYTVKIAAVQYYQGTAAPQTVLELLVDGRVVKRSALASKAATRTHPTLIGWSVGQMFSTPLVVMPGTHAVELRLAAGTTSALGLRIGTPIAASVAAAAPAKPVPTPAGGLDALGPRAPASATAKPDLAYRTGQLFTSAGMFTGVYAPSFGSGRSQSVITGVMARHQLGETIGVGVTAAFAIFNEAIPKRRWIGFQVQPVQGHLYYHVPGDYVQPYVVGGLGPVFGRSDMFLVDDRRTEQTVGGGAMIGGGLEYDAFRDEAALNEGRLQIFAEVNANAMYLPFAAHGRDDFLGASVVLGGMYKW